MSKDAGARAVKRSPAAAFVLSFVVPGLGQVYNGQLRRGLLFFGTSVFLAPLLFVLPIGLYPAGLAVVALALLLFRPLAAVDAAWSARRAGTVVLRSFNRVPAYVGIGLTAIVIGWVRTPLLEGVRRVDLYRVPAESMVPTLLVGDFFAADRAGFIDDGPRPGDLVVFEAPVPNPELFVQRVVAAEGDTVEVRGGVLVVNGEQAPKLLQGARRGSRVKPPGVVDPMVVPAGAGNADHYGPVVVPPDGLFILGDSRDNSIDSRYYGTVGMGAIVARPLYVAVSFDHERSGIRLERFGLDLDSR